MAALVSLSTAANVAAMISLADMAFKTGTQVFDLYCRYRDVSSSMAQLVDEIQAATSNTAQVRIFMQEFEASAFAIDHGHTIPQIQQLLCLIDQEFKIPRKLMQDTRPSSSGSWLGLFQQVTGHMRLSLEEHKVAASCTRLHRLSCHMNNALGITGRRNEIVLRNELTAARAEVAKFADTAKRLQDHMDVLAVMPSTNAVGSTAHAVRVPPRNSRARLRAPRLGRKQGDILPDISGDKSEIISMRPSHMDDSRSEVIRKVSLWDSEIGAVEIVSLPPDDITLPLIHVKGLLRTAIDDVKLSDHLLISKKQAEWIAVIVDQLLAYSHVTAAVSLSRGLQRVATAEDHLIAPCGLDISGMTAQVPPFQSGAGIVPIKRTLQRRRFVSGLWTMQTFSKTTRWGTIKAEMYLIGDRLYSEILCFRVRFSPNRHLSDIGIVLDYASHQVDSLVCFGRQQSELTERHIVVFFANLARGPIFEGGASFTLKPVDLSTKQIIIDYPGINMGISGSWLELQVVVEYIQTEQGTTFTPLRFRETCRTSVAIWYTGFSLSDIEVPLFLEVPLSEFGVLQLIMSLVDDIYERYCPV